MNPTFSPSFIRDYCSQQGGLSSSLHTFEEGLKLIEDTLQKKILCCHDVIHLNHAYSTVHHQESKEKITSNKNASSLLLKLAERIQALKDLSQASAEEIITAYHLQSFKALTPNEADISFCPPQNLTLEKIREIATHLPFCKSKKQFELDVEALLGKSDSSDITALLQSKKDRFCEYQKRERLDELKQLREQNASLYPAYLEEILQEGCFSLYDHLIDMKALSTKAERTTAIEKLSFSSFAHIILEYRKIVLSQVEQMMPQGNHNIVFLLGNTGSGKSTTLCYLRGDQMILKGNGYQSSTDKEHLIGNNHETSCTFFPNISIKEGLVLVDFPGFADTHGEVIALAIELTLRALTRKYLPKIVILTSITDNGSRFEHVHLLGKRLKRVLGTLDNCLLGLTKYSQDVDFIGINNIERMQRDILFAPSEEEKNLEQQIKALEPFAGIVPAIQTQVDQHRERLLQLQELRLSSSDQILPDTEEKSEHYNNLLQKEEAFKKHSGIKNIIALKDLTDQNDLEEIIHILGVQEKNVPILVPNKLDASDEKLLDTLFTSNLIKVITAEQKSLTPSFNPSLIAVSKNELSEKLEEFEQSILETSLINALLEKSHPEIGELLHLESVDPAIVRKYDKGVITGCINGYIDEVISGLLVAEEILKGLRSKYALQQNKEAEREWSSLRSYILTLSKGIAPNADPHKIEEVWKSLQKEHKERLDKSDKELKFPGWVEVMLLIPLGIPYGIFHIFKKIKQNKTSQAFMKDAAEKLYQGIKAASEAVIKLKDIENTVKKKEQFDAIFSSYPLSLNSVSSLKKSLEKQISEVEKIYGKEEWNKRIAFITNQLTLNFTSIRPISPLGENILYALISQKIVCKDLPPYFNEHTFLALIYSFLSSSLGSNLTDSKGGYQEILKQLMPSWEFTNYRNLNLSNFSYFFHSSIVTRQDYHLLNIQGKKILESYNKNPILRLLFADVIYRLWKELAPPVNDNQKHGFFNSSLKNDQDKILEIIWENAWIFEYSKEHVRCDKEFLLSAIKVNSQSFTFAQDFLKNNREFALTAVEVNGQALEYASEELKNDREIVLAAVKQNGWALEYASEELKNDREFILAAVKQNGWALQYTIKRLKNDREIVLAAVQQNGRALEYTSERLKNDREIVLAAVQQNGAALEDASEALKNDQEIGFASQKNKWGYFNG
ncbi:DUF4116 domain-containing protein [Rhabdochlamydiaceae symbiont of Dictyostelium giganteum]|uniref:DUF4116 domain-containing protein n=1 Tax=Rhabdochlamydiaceae symbiont of Dictyostelium giganteum TaxID=3342349 RepID=UPI00385085AF